MRIWLLVALYFACAGLLNLLSKSGAFAWLAAGPDDGFSADYGRWANALSGFICFAIPAIVYANVFPVERFRSFRLHVRVPAMALIVSIGTMIAFLPLADVVADWCARQITDPSFKEYQDLIYKDSMWRLNMPGVGQLLLLLFASALVPAICEELFFRASIQQLFCELFKRSPQTGIWVTAAFFALIHFNPADFAVIFVAGLLLGYAFYWTGSLRTTILMHFFFNATSLIENYFVQHSAAFRAWNPGGLFFAVCVAVTFVCFGLIFRFSVKKT